MLMPPMHRRQKPRKLRRATVLPRRSSMTKCFVYVLKNKENRPRYYTGITPDVTRRTVEHNAGNCVHTAKYRPWYVDLVIEFPDERRAAAFERYLKSGS